jgi:uncharacterized LabA/DUF88 family protein
LEVAAVDRRQNDGRPPRRNVAIFIDMENLFGGYKDTVGGVSVGRILRDINDVIRRLDVGTAVAVSRAYANWSDSRMNNYRREMMEHGVEPVQVFSFGTAVKNAADIELVVDALGVAYSSPEIDVFVVVSGDGGFVPLVRRLHALGRYTIIVAWKEQKVSKLLPSVADHFHRIGDDLADDDTGGESDPVRPGDAPEQAPPVLAPSRDEVLEYVRRLAAMHQDLFHHDGTALDSTRLGKLLRAKFPGFAATSLGFKNLTKLCETALDISLVPLQSLAAQPGDQPPVVPTPVTKFRAILLTRPQSRSEFGAVVHDILADADVVGALSEAEEPAGMNYERFRWIVAESAPNLDWAAAGFPSMKISMQYALHGTQYQLARDVSNPGVHRVVAREAVLADGFEVLQDLDESNIGSPEVLRQVMQRSTPPLRIPNRSAVAAVIEAVTSPEMRAMPLADLLDRVSDSFPDESAEALRAGIDLLVAAGVLTVPEPSVSIVGQELTADSGFGTYESVTDALFTLAKARLESMRWPVNEGSLELLIPFE